MRRGQPAVLEEPITQRVVDGITFSYPPDSVRLSEDQIGPLCSLSAAHAVGDIVPLEPNPKKYPAQGSFCVESPLLDTDRMIAFGEVVHKGFGRLIESMLSDNRTLRGLRSVGEDLEAGRNVAHAIFHGPLLDDGLANGAATVALKVLRYDFRSAMIVSGGTTGLGIKLKGDETPEGTSIPMTYAINTGSHKVWHTYPNTDNARQTEFGKSVPEEQIKGLNKTWLRGFTKDLKTGGWLYTILPDASTHLRGPNGEFMLHNPGAATLRLMSDPDTRVQAAGARFMGREEALYGFFGDMRKLSRFNLIRLLQGDAMMLDLASGATELIPDEEFVATPPRRAGSFAVGLFQQLKS